MTWLLVRRLGRFFPLALALALAAAPTLARAAENPEELIRQGLQMRREGNDLAAFGYFKRSFEIAHTPRGGAQLGLVEFAIGHEVDAEAHLTEALTADDPWVSKNRAALEATRDKARAKLGRIDLHGAPADAVVTVAGRPPGPVLVDTTIWVKPGEVDFTVSAPGHQSDTRTVNVAAGATLTVELSMPSKTLAPTVPTVVTPAPVPETPPARSDRGRARIVGIATVAAGVAIAATGFILYRVGVSKLEAIKNDATTKPYDPGNGNYQTFGDAGIALMVTGGAAVAAGAIWYGLHRGETSEGATPSQVAFGYAPGVGGNVRLGWNF